MFCRAYSVSQLYKCASRSLSLMMSWNIVVHKDEIRPVLFIERHNDAINDDVQKCGAFL